MRRIKVTGYMPVEDMEESFLDLDHSTGLSEEGFEHCSVIFNMEDLQFELQDDE